MKNHADTAIPLLVGILITHRSLFTKIQSQKISRLVVGLILSEGQSRAEQYPTW